MAGKIAGFLGLVALPLLSACDPITGQVCTLVGCDDQLVVNVEGAFDSSFTVRMSFPGSAPVEAACSEGSCMVVSGGAAPSEVTIEVLDDSGAVVYTATASPEYQVFEPNGPDCPPSCLQAELTLVA